MRYLAPGRFVNWGFPSEHACWGNPDTESFLRCSIAGAVEFAQHLYKYWLWVCKKARNSVDFQHQEKLPWRFR